MKNSICLIGLLFLSFSVQAEEEWIDLEKQSGAGLFQEKCGMCHRPGGMGTGILGRRMSPEMSLLENRKDLQAPYIENVVRKGFGIMFSISRAEVSDQQLEKISTYLTEEEQ